MQHFKRHGAFLPTTSSIDDATEIEDQENSVSSTYKGMPLLTFIIAQDCLLCLVFKHQRVKLASA